MYAASIFFVYMTLFQMLSTARCYHHHCSRAEYDRCVKIADPLVKEARLIFPDNLDDIDLVCRNWNRFVDCLKSYTDNCFSVEQRRQFNKAVENPIESVHQMCMQPNYQKEYLHYAPCIKNTITDPSHCGQHYNLLVDQVDQGDDISRATLCCSHDRFKQCIARETRQLCDRGALNGPALQFSTHIIDKALSFLQDQCYNYIPNSGDCATFSTNNGHFTDPLMISTSSSEVYPWSTIQEAAAPKEMPSSKITPPKATTSWLPSSSLPLDSSSNSESSLSDILGSRTRPASYGRSSSWSDSASQNTQQMYSETPPTDSARPEWATISTWHVLTHSPSTPAPDVPGVKVTSQDDLYRHSFSAGYDNSFSPDTSPDDNAMSSSTETWYPAAGDQLANEVDEPNQQGLTKPKNGADVKGKEVISMTVIAAVLAFC